MPRLVELQPASISQIREGANGRWIEIDADVGGVVDELKRLDPQLGVRFNDHAKFFAVYWRSPDGRDEYLVTTFRAYQTASGTWAGLDGRIVKRLEQIDSQNRSGYDYAEELRRQDEAAEAARKHAFAEEIGETAEMAAHALRKDLGESYRGRVFVPRDV